MKPILTLLTALLLAPLAAPDAALNAADAPPPAKIAFNRDVRPILSDNCFYCHGNDPSHRKAKLRLDVREEALEKEAFVPGKPDESELIARILTTDEDELNPLHPQADGEAVAAGFKKQIPISCNACAHASAASRRGLLTLASTHAAQP